MSEDPQIINNPKPIQVLQNQNMFEPQNLDSSQVKTAVVSLAFLDCTSTQSGFYNCQNNWNLCCFYGNPDSITLSTRRILQWKIMEAWVLLPSSFLCLNIIHYLLFLLSSFLPYTFFLAFTAKNIGQAKCKEGWGGWRHWLQKETKWISVCKIVCKRLYNKCKHISQMWPFARVL